MTLIGTSEVRMPSSEVWNLRSRTPSRRPTSKSTTCFAPGPPCPSTGGRHRPADSDPVGLAAAKLMITFGYEHRSLCNLRRRLWRLFQYLPPQRPQATSPLSLPNVGPHCRYMAGLTPPEG